MRRKYTFFCLIIHCAIVTLQLPATAQEDHSNPKWGEWNSWGDQQDGTYRNPLLPGDYSDIDCICVGDDYYAISSTFQFSPGMVILHSKDLVNWTIKGHAVPDLTQISPELNWDRMNRYAHGIWAGAIRYHNNKFWVYFGTPDEGYFVTTASKIEGPWEPLHCLMPASGWDDCCPFWDDDGQGYLVGSCFADGYKIHLFKLTPDGKDIIKSSDEVIHQSKGSEANKLYKINGLYYHFYSEVKESGIRVTMMERSKNIRGPYTEIKQLGNELKEELEPNQGGFVQTPDGGWYFLTHHGTGDWSGRIMSLLPVKWIDGWPIPGIPDSLNQGDMAWSGNIPVAGKKRSRPQSTDFFTSKELGHQWEWNYQPRKEKWSLTKRRGYLRLSAFKPLEAGNLTKVGNIITQRSMRTARNEVIVKLEIAGMADNQKTGLTHFGMPDYSSIGVSCEGNQKKLFYNVKGVEQSGPLLTSNKLWLKSVWGLDGQSQYYYSVDGKNFVAFGDKYQLKWGYYRGDRIGIYSYNNSSENGFIDVDYFKYDYD